VRQVLEGALVEAKPPAEGRKDESHEAFTPENVRKG
jgi:hypothetical protein